MTGRLAINTIYALVHVTRQRCGLLLLRTTLSASETFVFTQNSTPMTVPLSGNTSVPAASFNRLT
jgi:hypothetical protein